MRLDRRHVAIGGALLVVLVGAGVAGRALVDDASGAPAVLVERARFPTAMVALPDGGLLYAERYGAVRAVGPDGRLQAEPVAAVDTEPGDDDQRGFLGLARDDDSRLFAAWTQATDGRLVVGQLLPSRRLVWEGPPSADRANGGHLEVGADGRLVVGIGDLLERRLVDDPAAPNGKLLLLDPDGPPTQRPRVVSAGWNNPFAFTRTPGGAVWVADNAPGTEPERLARGDRDRRPTSVTELPGISAPSGLAALSERRLAMCGFVSGELRIYDIRSDGGAVEDEGERVEGCRLGVVLLADGRVAIAEEDRIRTVDVGA